MFARGTTMGLSSILNRGGIFSKVSLPLEIPAISVSITSFIMMTFEFAVFFVFMIVFQFIPPVTILWLPLLLLLTLVLTIGISLPLSVMYVFYRDLGYMWGVILQAGFFLSPIIYDLSIFPEEIRSWFYYNPMAGILNIGHAIVLGSAMPSTFEILYTVFIPFIILGIGYIIFKRYLVRVVEEL
jgi:lipopolysaccharide transport system permease protein